MLVSSCTKSGIFCSAQRLKAYSSPSLQSHTSAISSGFLFKNISFSKLSKVFSKDLEFYSLYVLDSLG